ncbi:MAG: alkaline phytoceramidase [Tatlockia sp.]|nr:alkaline phytoceramidase [Tatlockia sp.]
MIAKKKGIILLIVVTVMMVAIGFSLKPIAQPQDYHRFVDQRSWQGIPNASNVLSNLPFAMAGVWGLVLLFSSGKIQFNDRRERWPWVLVAIGLILTAFGSSYYHLAPDNARLFWDRLPMTLIFMSFVAALLCERININLGLWLLPLLLCIGFYSVWYWYSTELRGQGDLRLYAAVQLYPLAAALVLLSLPSPYNKTHDLAIIAGFYVLAKLFEIFDKQIYEFSDHIVSGHCLKHLAAAMAGFWLVRMIWKRKTIMRDSR